MNLEEATIKALNGKLTEEVNQNVLTKLNTELKKLNGRRVYLDELKSDVEKTLASVLGKEILSQVEWYKFEPEDKYEFSGFLEIDGIEDDVEVMVEILDHKSHVELRVGGDELSESKHLNEDNLANVDDIKHLPNIKGKCPFCGEEYLDYEALKLEGDMEYYPWTCHNCGHKGEEWYDVIFAGHNVYDENDDLIELEEMKK